MSRRMHDLPHFFMTGGAGTEIHGCTDSLRSPLTDGAVFNFSSKALRIKARGSTERTNDGRPIL